MLNVTTEEEMQVVNTALGKIAYECGEYYHCNAEVHIYSEQYKMYDEWVKRDYPNMLLTTTYDIEDQTISTEWYEH